ncbi:SapC family protein [Roseovarius sp. MMSF_3281]|uniref:SapC family protein n=1 Tax=Roseovarius sp. MMSF_3281 TaxID=3046694 RepID=UPI00273F2BC2|nr:SapC family protein [Roseovarius sp. MMSF_3281]
MSDATSKTLVAVSPQRHGARYWRRFESYSFARAAHCVDIVMAELPPVASAFPLVFRESFDGAAITPIALLSFGRSENTPFVSADGNWRGTYVPSALRAHPFTAHSTETAREMTLLVDEASGLVTDDPSDQPFFDTGGAPSQALAQVIEFFRTRALSAIQTQKACAELNAAGLLTQLHDFAGMSQPDLQGLYGIDFDKLDSLDASALPALWQSGALRLAEAHRISLCHIGWMLRAERASAGLEPQAAATRPPSQADTALSGFLDALSDAQDQDWSNRS